MECTAHRLVADVALLAGDQVLLVKYKDVRRYDGQRGWFLPDDLLADREHPEAAARRIAKEQAGLELPDLRLGHIESFGNGAWHLIFHFRADLTNPARVASSGNVAEAKWFDLVRLPPPEDVAHHGWALDVLRALMKE